MRTLKYLNIVQITLQSAHVSIRNNISAISMDDS